jgi:hypothetical protein
MSEYKKVVMDRGCFFGIDQYDVLWVTGRNKGG